MTALPDEHARDAPVARVDSGVVAAAAQLACLLEASAPKPGNVSPGRHFADARYEHFLASAAAIGVPLAAAGVRPLGETIGYAVEATAGWSRSNTNLGIVLLLVPIAKAALTMPLTVAAGAVGWPSPWRERDAALRQLRSAVRGVLDEATVEDARRVYAAIRLARPGGLGTADAEDVSGEPGVTLLDAMRLAADRDGIAREYATGFATTFETAVPALARARADGLTWDDAVVETFLRVLEAAADTHIVRRGGAALAAEVSRRAADTLRAGGVRSDAGRRALQDMDAALRGATNTANPGTTADITAAALFVYLLAGGWHAPRT